MAQATWARAGGYTSGMARKSDADRPTPPPSRPHEEQGENRESTETFRAVALQRHVKDDGRKLILYTHRRSCDDGADAGRRA